MRNFVQHFHDQNQFQLFCAVVQSGQGKSATLNVMNKVRQPN